MGFRVFETSAYKKDLKRCVKTGYQVLRGTARRSCHIKPDWLLIRDWSSVGDELVLVLVRTGTQFRLVQAGPVLAIYPGSPPAE